VVPVELDEELDELDEDELDEEELEDEFEDELELLAAPVVVPDELPEDVSDGVVTCDCGGTMDRMSVSIFRSTARTRRASLTSSWPANVIRR
jgi:hypothetical protein